MSMYSVTDYTGFDFISMVVYSDNYHQTCNTSGILVGNEIIDHADVVGTSPVSTAPTASSFST